MLLDSYAVTSLAHIEHVSRLRFFCTGIFKTINRLNPSFIFKEILKVKSSNYLLREINNLENYRPNQVTFGSNSLRFKGPRLWNGLPYDIKSAENLTILKDMLKSGKPLILNVGYVYTQAILSLSHCKLSM